MAILFELIRSSDQVQMRVREVGAKYFNGMVNKYWSVCLHEEDKSYVREYLIDAIVHSSDSIRAQLILCVGYIAKNDFPEKWPTFVDTVHYFMQSPDINSWYGSLQAFYQICDLYE